MAILTADEPVPDNHARGGKLMTEREAIVAWLRKERARHNISAEKLANNLDRANADKFAAYAYAYDVAADAIERGDHLKDKPEREAIVRDRPGVWLGSDYLGRLPFERPFPGGAVIVGAVFRSADHPARWMDDGEYDQRFSAHLKDKPE